MGQLYRFVHSVVFWSYERGTLPYDVMCSAILLFIFLTPSHFFQDQPTLNMNDIRQYGQEDLVYTQDDRGNPVLSISTRLIAPDQDEKSLRHAAQTELQKLLNRPISIGDIKPVLGAKGETIAYSVWLDEQRSSPH